MYMCTRLFSFKITIMSSPLSSSQIDMCPRSVPTATSPVPIPVLEMHTALSPFSEHSTAGWVASVVVVGTFSV